MLWNWGSFIFTKVTISAGIGRIANGSQAAAGEFPWIVSISENAQHICGGFIYNDRFIVSAASCLFGWKSAEIIVKELVWLDVDCVLDCRKTSINLKVKAGATSLTTPGPYDQNIAVYSFLVHPNYDPITKKNDLALVLVGIKLNRDDLIVSLRTSKLYRLIDRLYLIITSKPFVTMRWMRQSPQAPLQDSVPP